MFVCFNVYNGSTAATEMCVCIQNSMDLGETVPSVCSETCLTVSADGSDASDIRAEEVLHTQEEEDHLASTSPVDKAADKVCYVCNIVVLTVVQAVMWHLHSGTVLCSVVFRCDCRVKSEVVCCFESLVPTHDIKNSNM